MQDLVAILIAVVAAGFLVWRGWRYLSARRAGCGACAHCPASGADEARGLVTIAPVAPRCDTGRKA